MLTPEQKEQFLEAFETHGSVTKAAAVIGVNRRYAYFAKEDDPAFSEAWDDAKEAMLDRAEEVIHNSLDDPDQATSTAKWLLTNTRSKHRRIGQGRDESEALTDVTIEVVESDA